MKNPTSFTTETQPPIVKASLLNKEGVATSLGVAVRTLDHLVATGEFPPGVRIGRCLFWTEAAVTAWHQRVFAVQLGWNP